MRSRIIAGAATPISGHRPLIIEGIVATVFQVRNLLASGNRIAQIAQVALN
jgi:hypothetical protein